jgi:hypothetical protein
MMPTKDYPWAVPLRVTINLWRFVVEQSVGKLAQSLQMFHCMRFLRIFNLLLTLPFDSLYIWHPPAPYESSNEHVVAGLFMPRTR